MICDGDTARSPIDIMIVMDFQVVTRLPLTTSTIAIWLV
jgi:hypothetical protein